MMVSCGCPINEQLVLIAGEGGLFEFDLISRRVTFLAPLDEKKFETRSNDGREDPWGGFWFSTMGKEKEESADQSIVSMMGSLLSGATFDHLIQFVFRKKTIAYFSDTFEQIIWSQRLDERGFQLTRKQSF